MSDKRQPWLKFYPADWRADPRLRMCSYAARGLWIDVIAVMHEAEPYGHLLVNGRAPTPRQLAGLLGGTERQVTALLAELEEAGVFSRTEDGVIYSRRMVRDRERSEEGRKQVAKRWGGGDPTGDPTAPPNRSPTETPITQKPEARGQKLESRQEDLLAPQASPKTQRATRIPEDWVLTPELRQVAEQTRKSANLPPVNIELEAQKFKDFWTAKSGKDATKTDWLATWRNWIRNARSTPKAPGAQPDMSDFDRRIDAMQRELSGHG